MNTYFTLTNQIRTAQQRVTGGGEESRAAIARKGYVNFSSKAKSLKLVDSRLLYYKPPIPRPASRIKVWTTITVISN